MLLALQISPGAARERLHREDSRVQCVGCHAGAGPGSRVGRNPKTGKLKDITIVFPRLFSADHGELDCQECHGKGFHRVPHARVRKIRTCMECHPRKGAEAPEDEKYEFERIEKEFKQTAHFTEHADEFGCEDCHDPHYFKAAAHFDTPQQILEDNNGPCLRCHKADATGPLADAAKPNLVALHDFVSSPRLHLSKTRCVDCHTNVDQTVAHDLPTGEEANDCVSCHTRESVIVSRQYRSYADGENVKLGFSNASLLESSYVMGATRHALLDRVTYLLLGIAATFIAAHGTARLIARARGRGRPSTRSGPRRVRSR